MRRVRPPASRTVGRVGLEVDELLGVDDREALRVQARADEGQRGGGGLARVVPALEGAHESGRPEPRGAAVPAQRLHVPRATVAGHRASGRPAAAAACRPPLRTKHQPRALGRALRAAPRRRRRRRLRLHAQGPADRPHRLAVPGAGAARPHERAARARVPRRRPARRPLRARRPRARAGARRALPRRAAGRGAGDRARRGRRPGRLPARRLPRRRRARRLPRAPRARGPRPGLPRGCSRSSWPTARCARSGAAPRAPAPATTPTSAGCSSTPSPSARSRSRRASCTPGSTATCSSAPRSSTTSARRASSPTARRSA